MMEHLALSCDLDLQGFCERFQRAMDLPAFKYDAETVAEWGLVEADNVEYNVMKFKNRGVPESWDDTVPPGCNFRISLILYREHPHAADHEWAFENLVLPVGQKIADTFGASVHYHRTWIRSGKWFGDVKNVKRDLEIHPAKNQM
jgi:hypothetical protein